MGRLLKWISIGITVSIAVGVSWFFISAERFDVYRHSISATIRSESGSGGEWGTLVNLIPSEFSMGESGESARKKLASAGYERVPDDLVWKRYSYLIEEGKTLYSREADNLVCAMRLRVFIEFDSADQVIFAQGNIHEHGCL